MGFRALCFGYKKLSQQEIVKFDETDLEQGLTILGISGMEDLLQQDVAKCITEFKDAGLKVWILTGDKMETA
jgi:magnesium-transporting ATPase (P-type)